MQQQGRLSGSPERVRCLYYVTVRLDRGKVYGFVGHYRALGYVNVKFYFIKK